MVTPLDDHGPTRTTPAGAPVIHRGRAGRSPPRRRRVAHGTGWAGRTRRDLVHHAVEHELCARPPIARRPRAPQRVDVLGEAAAAPLAAVVRKRHWFDGSGSTEGWEQC